MYSFILTTASKQGGHSYRYLVKGSPDEVRGLVESHRRAETFMPVPDSSGEDRPPFYVNPEHVVSIYPEEP